MYRKLIVAGVLMLVVSCKTDVGNHLPAKKMQAVLTDLHLAESYSMVLKNNSLSQPTTKNLDSLAVYYASIFKHHDITNEQFNSSLEWYKDHPQDLDSIYASMLPEFSKLQSKFGGDN